MNALTIKLISTLTGLALACISSVAFAQSGTGAVLASVNGTKIYTSQVNEIVGMAVTDGAKETPELRQNILNEMIIREAVSQDVKKTGLLDKDSNTLKLRLARSNTIFEIWFSQYLKTNPITEADIKAEYERRLAVFSDVAGYTPRASLFSLLASLYFKRQYFPPATVTSRYMPPESE
jgi:peptidyl-prolyl cis-trans isomerase C